jgi:hypothetical protein
MAAVLDRLLHDDEAAFFEHLHEPLGDNPAIVSAD